MYAIVEPFITVYSVVVTQGPGLHTLGYIDEGVLYVPCDSTKSITIQARPIFYRSFELVLEAWACPLALRPRHSSVS